MEKSTYQTSKIFDLEVFSSPKQDLLSFLTSRLDSNIGPLLVMTPNPEQIIISRNNESFLHTLQSADVLIPDGIGLVVASKMLSLFGKIQPLQERITGREVTLDLLKLVAKDGLTSLVLGGQGYASPSQVAPPEIAIPIGKQLSAKVYWFEGYADIQHPTKTEEAAVLAVLKKLKPIFVFVAFGAPWQEVWLMSHKTELRAAGVKLAMAVGGAFDVLTAKIAPAPAVLEKLGLEWLYRLWQEPWRWRRQLKLLEFIKLVFQSI
ncbi:MAG: hypothetical protein COU66_03270 [Candidatus Pacebacteria bacterium CG10_big_fil_rev_8_21_14_0_10_44_11]|nr:MAG: hypothetical protein COU66_03270 [Candidatus Pacebacteria bacterium CG10_big_fil_rev_8_21_14_0_10_44_11]